MDEQQKQQMSSRQQAREQMRASLEKFIRNSALPQSAINHYTQYLERSESYGDRDTSNVNWDDQGNHRARYGERYAIDGTHDEMIVEAALYTASNTPCERITEKLMQMYGQDLKHDKTIYSVKGRIHHITPIGDYVFDLEDQDFKPGIYRVHKLAFVDRDSQLLTLLPYRQLANYCCTISKKNIPERRVRNRVVCQEFDNKHTAKTETYDLNKFGWDK